MITIKKNILYDRRLRYIYLFLQNLKLKKNKFLFNRNLIKNYNFYNCFLNIFKNKKFFFLLSSYFFIKLNKFIVNPFCILKKKLFNFEFNFNDLLFKQNLIFFFLKNKYKN